MNKFEASFARNSHDDQSEQFRPRGDLPSVKFVYTRTKQTTLKLIQQQKEYFFKDYNLVHGRILIAHDSGRCMFGEIQFKASGNSRMRIE